MMPHVSSVSHIFWIWSSVTTPLMFTSYFSVPILTTKSKMDPPITTGRLATPVWLSAPPTADSRDFCLESAKFGADFLCASVSIEEFVGSLPKWNTGLRSRLPVGLGSFRIRENSAAISPPIRALFRIRPISEVIRSRENLERRKYMNVKITWISWTEF